MIDLCDELKRNGKAGELTALLKTLRNECRLRIVRKLAERKRCVSELGTFVDASQSSLSQYLVVLRHDGCVCARRAGQRFYYTLAPAAEHEIRVLLHELIPTDAAGSGIDHEGDRAPDSARSQNGEE